MDIRQFQSAIPIFNDILEYSGLTVASLQDSSNAAELLFGAFKKAGEAGGITAEGFSAQAGTWNQQISNLKDNITILSASILEQTGIFSALKGVLQGLNDFLGNEDLIIGAFQGGLTFIRENLPVIIGMIGGALIPVFRVLALRLAALGTSFGSLLPFIAVGGLIGLGLQLLVGLIQRVVEHLGGWDATMDFLRGKLQPFVDLIDHINTRLGQLRDELGITGEFGSIVVPLMAFAEDMAFYAERSIQIARGLYDDLKRWLAFGTIDTEVNATSIEALGGIWTRLQPLVEALRPIIEHIATQLNLTGEIIRTQVAPAFNALMEVMKPLLEALMPYFIELLKELAIVLGGVLAVILAVVTGVLSGLANALPYIAQALEGVIQFVRICADINWFNYWRFRISLGGMKQGFRERGFHYKYFNRSREVCYWIC